MEATTTTDERTLTSQGAERKAQLLRSAEQLFADKGYASTRIIDICTAAGVVKSLFYWYFPTKRDCYIELVRTRRHELRAAQAKAMDRSANPLTQIRQGTEASVRFMTEHASYFAHVSTERSEPEISAVVTKGGGVYHDDVAALIRRGQADGVIVDADPSLLAIGVITTVASYSNSRRAGHTKVEVDELATFVGDWIVRSLSAR